MQLANFLPLAVFWDATIVRWGVWIGLVALTIALLLLIRTRWGQSQPLGKCVVLSLLGHLLLAIYISTVNIVTATVGSPQGRGIQVSLADPGAPEGRSTDPNDLDPWNAISGESNDAGIGPTGNTKLVVPPRERAPILPRPIAEPERSAPTPRDDAAGTKLLSQMPGRSTADIDFPAPDIAPPKADRAAMSTLGAPESIDPVPTPTSDNLVPPPEPVDVPAKSASGGSAGGGDGSPDGAAPMLPIVPLTPGTREGGGHSGDAPGGAGTPQGVPEIYRNRTGDHAQTGRGFGATQESEAAVKDALRFLARMQNGDGRWESRRLGGGAGLAADMQDRNSGGGQSGMQADTAITGLALLAFLAAGNTHEQGTHKKTVQHGLEFLLAVQQPNGNLGISNNIYEKMYSHAMATCALSEAYAMSRDKRLQQAVERAIGFTVSCQDRNTGGWRYRPGDPGDTSQLGWQVMGLKSAQLAGIPIRDETRRGIQRFLKSVSVGDEGGLARYQPPSQFTPLKPATRPMTAEAMACRQFMGMVDAPGVREEACSFLLQEVPGVGTTNHYYWYYASLALCQIQGEPWKRWNTALQKNLLATQRKEGELAGSWDPDPVWGGCGGRGYSTALSTLCLEVPYRFLPLHGGNERLGAGPENPKK